MLEMMIDLILDMALFMVMVKIYYVEVESGKWKGWKVEIVESGKTYLSTIPK